MASPTIYARPTLGDLIKELYPDIKWDRFEEADRALNWEVWHGELPSQYWVTVEPLEHYTWKGWPQACSDIEEILESLPHEMWYDSDCDCVSESDPDDDEYNFDEHFNWIGSDGWRVINPRKELMHEESWKQVF